MARSPASASVRPHLPRAAAALLLGLLLGSTGLRAEPAIFQGADLAMGRKLIQENRCDACHAEKTGGKPHAIYRPGKRLTNAGYLRGMVEQCNTELGLSLFPEDVTAIAAVLNLEHYRFKD